MCFYHMLLWVGRHLKHFKNYRAIKSDHTMKVRKDAGKETKLSRFIFFYFCLRLVFTPLGSLAIVWVLVYDSTNHTFLFSTSWIWRAKTRKHLRNPETLKRSKLNLLFLLALLSYSLFLKILTPPAPIFNPHLLIL